MAPPGMGAIPHPGGTGFRVWAPHAQAVAVVGDFNGWDGNRDPLRQEQGGYWSLDVPAARVGHHYRYRLETAAGVIDRIDPFAREVTSSVGNGVVHEPCFDWGEESFSLAPWNQLAIYELHVGTFNEEPLQPSGQFSTVSARLEHLQKLGINAIQIMPVGQFAGLHSWGYNPSHIFAVDSDYGGPVAFKRFIKRAHSFGIAVILDVVYNHFGPSDLDLWCFDGWSEGEWGGIYFYNDDRARTPWGDTRPDYGRPEVRQYILDNVAMWFEDYHLDGLRLDSTVHVRSLHGFGGQELPDGWSLMQAISDQVAQRFPGRLLIAEDMQGNSWLTKGVGAGGAGFGAQWDIHFVQLIRRAVITAVDEERSLDDIVKALSYRYNDDAFERVIYSESHDDVANGQSRVPYAVDPGDASGWYAQKRSTLAAALVFTAPGIPMLFQGQEFLEGAWFRDTVPIDWDHCETFRGIVLLYRDLLRLRLDRLGATRGLSGQFTRIFHHNEQQKLLAFQRWDRGGPGDDVVLVVNFSNASIWEERIGFPRAGTWRVRFNSDWEGYSDGFSNHPSQDVATMAGELDGFPCQGTVSVGAYSVLILSQ